MRGFFALLHPHKTMTPSIPEQRVIVGAVSSALSAWASPPIQAAGIALVAGGKVLLLKRGAGGDYPEYWSLPGGKVEPGESPEQAASREVLEESGFQVLGAMRQLSFMDNGKVAFTTFGKAVSQFTPTLCDENTDFIWADADKYPEPLHPGTRLTLESGVLDSINPLKMNELELARAMAAGELPSPQRYMNVWLFAMRITGTGVAYRTADNEFVFRNPELYLNDEFLARCNGLVVIAEHPEKKTMNSQEFVDRNIGSIFLPYIVGDEVWGISKIYDAAAAHMMEKNQLSTSPTVVFSDPAANSTIKLEDGATLLIEGKPSLLDHVAICIQGVWDKGGPPSGVSTNNVQENQMTDEELKAKADAEAKEKADADAKAKADSEAKARADADDDFKASMKKFCDSMEKRMDSLEADKKKADSNLPAPTQTAADAEAEEKEKEAKAKADAEEAEKRGEEEKVKAKADADETRKKIADLESRMPKEVSDADFAEMADAQSKADSVFAAFGDSAPRPWASETLLAYRKRLMTKLQAHSPDWKGVDLAGLDTAVVGIAEPRIYADAVKAAAHPVDLPAGTLRTIEKKDSNGQVIRTFIGDPNVWMGDFKSTAMRQVSVYKGNQ